MNFPFEIELYDAGKGDVLYTFRHLDRNENELDRFLDDPDVQDNPDFNRLVSRLTKGVDRSRGFRRYWFRDEGPVEALFAPYPQSERDALETPYPPALRLYCVRRIDIVIVGYGGVKTTRTYQQDDRLQKAVDELEYVDNCLQGRLDADRIWYTYEGLLGGNLTFD